MQHGAETRSHMPLTPPPSPPPGRYVHAAPGFRYKKTSMFFRRQIRNPVQVEWGEPSMVTAEKLLLREALADPLNERFVLLSEADIPVVRGPPRLPGVHRVALPRARPVPSYLLLPSRGARLPRPRIDNPRACAL